MILSPCHHAPGSEIPVLVEDGLLPNIAFPGEDPLCGTSVNNITDGPPPLEGHSMTGGEVKPEDDLEGGLGVGGCWDQSDVYTVFLEWLKSNKNSISLDDFRKIKLPRSTIESAMQRVCGTSEGMKYLVENILTWVQNFYLPKLRHQAGQQGVSSCTSFPCSQLHQMQDQNQVSTPLVHIPFPTISHANAVNKESPYLINYNTSMPKIHYSHGFCTGVSCILQAPRSEADLLAKPVVPSLIGYDNGNSHDSFAPCNVSTETLHPKDNYSNHSSHSQTFSLPDLLAIDPAASPWLPCSLPPPESNPALLFPYTSVLTSLDRLHPQNSTGNQLFFQWQRNSSTSAMREARKRRAARQRHICSMQLHNQKLSSVPIPTQPLSVMGLLAKGNGTDATQTKIVPEELATTTTES